jgi:hypothetical protein
LRKAHPNLRAADVGNIRAEFGNPKLLDEKVNLPLFEIARVVVCFKHVASFIVNANHSVHTH